MIISLYLIKNVCEIFNGFLLSIVFVKNMYNSKMSKIKTKIGLNCLIFYYP